MAGLLLGGALTEYLGWRWIMFINIPVALAVLAGTLALVPGTRGQCAAIVSHDAPKPRGRSGRTATITAPITSSSSRPVLSSRSSPADLAASM